MDLFPNLYTLLVSPPGVGKTNAINPAAELWKFSRHIKTAPDSVTSASLLDALKAAYRTQVLSPTEMFEYSSLAVPASEFGVLVPAHDLEFLSILNYIYDNPPSFRQTRRTSIVKDLDIPRPQLNIIAGTQPGYLATLLPETAWNMGFMSRMIMVYSSIPVKVELFGQRKAVDKPGLWKKLATDMKAMIKLFGKMSWEPEASTELTRWYEEGLLPAPTHSKLEHYKARRILHSAKLCMIASASRSNDAVITLRDLDRARSWLLAAEQTMPDIFRDMVSRSDSQVIQELHFALWQQWTHNHQQPVHVSYIVHFLQNRVPSEKIHRIIDIAEKANIIARVAGTNDRYVPRPRQEHGVE